MSKGTVAENALESLVEPWPTSWGFGRGWSSSPYFLISPGDTELAVEAVRAAARRFRHIDDHGHEIPDPIDHQKLDHYTPNWVFIARQDGDLWLGADTQGELPAVQGEAMLAALVQELDTRGVSAHVSVPAQGVAADAEDIEID